VIVSPRGGFTLMPNGNFATSIVRVRSEIWLLEGLMPPPTFLQRLWSRRAAQ
jgi:hypothetical protein